MATITSLKNFEFWKIAQESEAIFYGLFDEIKNSDLSFKGGK
jgi:hypothetical protein